MLSSYLVRTAARIMALVILSVLAGVSPGTVCAQQIFTCSASRTTLTESRLLRSSGAAELLPEIRFDCLGGNLAADLLFDLTVTLNANVTGKTVNGVPEALLIAGDVAPSAQVPGENIFPTSPQQSANSLTFPVRVTPAQASAGITLRLKNTRVDLSGLSSLLSVSFSTSSSVPILFPASLPIDRWWWQRVMDRNFKLHADRERVPIRLGENPPFGF